MIKDLAVVANKLDSLGMVKEADALDSIIKKLAGKDLGSEAEAKQYFAENPDKVPPHSGFQWPWETWNKLPPKVREDFYKSMDDFSSFSVNLGAFKLGVITLPIPILSQGTLGAEFALRCFEGSWSQAAVSLAYIIIGIIMSKVITKVNLSKIAPTALQTAGKTALELSKMEVVDKITGVTKVVFDKVAQTLDKYGSLQPLSQQLIAQKENIETYIGSELAKYPGLAT